VAVSIIGGGQGGHSLWKEKQAFTTESQLHVRQNGAAPSDACETLGSSTPSANKAPRIAITVRPIIITNLSTESDYHSILGDHKPQTVGGRFRCPSRLGTTYGRDPDGNVIELQEVLTAESPIALRLP